MKLEGDGTEGEAAFLHVVTLLKADGFARLVHRGPWNRPGREFDARGVEGRVNAADDRDAERRAELARRVVYGRADAGLFFGNDTHDRLGGRRSREPHPEADHDHLADDLEVRGREARGGHPGEAGADHREAHGDDDLVAEAHRESDSGD